MEELFQRGNDGYGDMRPYVISYTSVMNAWAGCRSRAAPGRSEQILRHVRDLQDSSNGAVVHDTVAYNIALKAWALCGKRETHNTQRISFTSWMHNAKAGMKFRIPMRTAIKLFSICTTRMAVLSRPKQRRNNFLKHWRINIHTETHL